MIDPYGVSWSHRAYADLEAIDAFIARESPQNATEMVERILAAIETLKLAPNRRIYK